MNTPRSSHYRVNTATTSWFSLNTPINFHAHESCILCSYHTAKENSYVCMSEHLILHLRQKFLCYSFGSLDDVFSVDFITKFFLSVLQKYSLPENKHDKLFWSTFKKKLLFSVPHSFYLPFTPNDKDTSEDEAFAKNVAHEAVSKGPQAVHPHSNSQEA